MDGGDAVANEDFSDIEKYGIITIGGTDKLGNPVFCFKVSERAQLIAQHFVPDHT